jgi:hypothetical protein
MTVKRCLDGIGAIAVLSFCGWAFAQGQTPPPASQPAPPEATQPTSGPSPRLELSPTKFDFGEIWQSMPVKRDFTIKNTGQADLTIGVRSSCGCTVATNPKSPLPPGESSTFSITYDSKRLGQADKKVTLSTNDPAQPNVDIAVVGKVKQVFKTSPDDRIQIKDLEPASAARAVLKLENAYGRPLSLKLKDGQDFGRFDITLKEIKPGMEYDLAAATRPPLNLGWNQVDVVLETGAEEVPTIMVPVSASAQPRVMAFPPMISVNPETKEPLEKVISVDYRKEKPIKITGVKPSLDAIKYELLPDEPISPERLNAAHKIRLTVPPYADVPGDGAKVEIFTDDQDPQYQKLEVRIIKLSEAPRVRRILPKGQDEGAAGKPVEPAGGKQK